MAAGCAPAGDGAATEVGDRAGAPPAAMESLEASPSGRTTAPDVRPGIEVLLTDSLHLVQGRRVGLVTNHTGVAWRGRDEDGPEGGDRPRPVSTVDLLAGAPGVELAALFGPEHGIRGDAAEGVAVESGTDPETGVPIHSLYGSTRRPSADVLRDLDVLLFDMQDVGARYYTYVSTMAYAMEAAGEAGLPFVVLDRPNPVRGDVVQGNVLDPAFATFVGLHPVPMRHGMTVGELARLYAGAYGLEAELHVVPMEGWDRSMAWPETGLPWIPPSPNLPSVASALAYPGTCLFEGTNLSVGRGTDAAFQQIGAPWLDGEALARTLEEHGFEGVRFEAVRFTPEAPTDGKHGGIEVSGVRLVPLSTDYDAPRAAVAMLVEARRAAGERWRWNEAHFDRLAGTDRLRMGIESGLGVDELTAGWSAATDAFRALRRPYLLY